LDVSILLTIVTTHSGVSAFFISLLKKLHRKFVPAKFCLQFVEDIFGYKSSIYFINSQFQNVRKNADHYKLILNKFIQIYGIRYKIYLYNI